MQYFDPKWIVAIICGIFSMVGLFLAAHGGGTEIYWIGLIMFVIGVGLVLGIIKRHMDQELGSGR